MGEITSAAAGLVVSKVGEPVIEKAASIIDNVYRDPKLEEKVLLTLKSKYENEPFYNSFSRFIEEYKVIEHLIDRFNSASTDDSLCESIFCEDNFQKFSGYYKYNPSEEPIIHEAFSLIFSNIYIAKVNIPHHSDIGKLQLDMHTIANENNADITQKLNAIMSSINDLKNERMPLKIDEPEKQEEASEKVKEFLKKVSDIGTNSKKSDEEVIKDYQILLAELAVELNNETRSQRNSVICKINCNIALRYSNIGNLEKAFDCLSKIDQDTAKASKTYHFVKAAIIINHCITEKYSDAAESINCALNIDKDYKQAVLLKAYLSALNKDATLQNIVDFLDNSFKDILDDKKDTSLIADYYTYRAFVFKEFGENYKSIESHLKARAFGYDEAVCDYNIGISYYAIATEHLPKSERIWCGDIKFDELLKALEIFKKWIFACDAKMSEFLRTRYICVYVSTCCLLGIKHNLSDISQYLTPKFDYETQRLIILGSDAAISEKEFSLLDDDDKTAAMISNYIRTNNITDIINFIESKSDEDITKLPQPIIYLLLQSCVIAKRVDLYDKFRSLTSTPSDLSLLECLDGYVEEIKGNVDRAKALLDKHAKGTNDYNLLHNIMLFYARNNFDTEHSELLLRILNLKAQNKTYIEDTVFFYSHSITFFTKIKSESVVLFTEALENENNISTINKLMLLADYFSSVGEQSKLLEVLTQIYDMQPTYKNGFNKAISLLHLMKYSEALEHAISLFESLEKGMEEEKSQTIGFICEAYLHLGEDDKSFEWAKKAHDLFVDIPSHPSHRNFLAIATRTNHLEALKDTIEYKKTHPVVVGKWITEFEISKSNPVESLEKALEKITGENPEERRARDNEFLRLHRKNILSNSMLLRHSNNSLSQYFYFAQNNKLHICDGNLQNLSYEQTLIKDDIFVDALTLIVLNKYKCLGLLNKIKNVHVCYSTINVLHSFVSSMEYNLYVSEVTDWLRNSKNVVFESNGFKTTTEIDEYLLEDMWVCCRASSKKSIPYLTIEHIVKKLQKFKLELFSDKLEIVSIPAFCYSVLSDNTEELWDVLYTLLEECSFISFRADTIIHQIQKDNYRVEEKSLERFFICNSDCDMVSFAQIYNAVIRMLLKDHFEASVMFSKMVVENCIKIWRRGDYYRNVVKNIVSDPESQRREDAINQYVILTVYMIKQIYNDIPSEIQGKYNELISRITKNFTSEYISQMMNSAFLQ